MPALLRNPIEMLDPLIQGRSLVKLAIGPRAVYVVNRPDLIRELLGGDRSLFARLGAEPVTEARLAGDSVAVLDGDAHAQRRLLIDQVFAGEAMQAYVDSVVACAGRLGRDWVEGGVVDLEAEMTTLSLDTIGRVTFGEDFARVGPTVRELYPLSRRVVWRGLTPVGSLMWRLPVGLTRRFDSARSAFMDAAAAVIRERRAGDRVSEDLLSRLLTVRCADGRSLTGEQVIDELWTYLAQGAPAYALVWTWWALAHHPRAERLLHDELEAVLAGRPPAADDLPRLHTARAIVLETLRLFPPSLGGVRRTARATRLSNTDIPAGAIILVNHWSTHHDPRFWPDPERFEPARWLPGAHPPDPFAYLPFSAGHRSCPARPLALVLAVAAIATLAQDWSPRPQRDSVSLAVIPFVRPKGGMPARLERRRTVAHQETSDQGPIKQR
jgi:cytochrome P450